MPRSVIDWTDPVAFACRVMRHEQARKTGIPDAVVVSMEQAGSRWASPQAALGSKEYVRGISMRRTGGRSRRYPSRAEGDD